jgi:hypothetical protein
LPSLDCAAPAGRTQGARGRHLAVARDGERPRIDYPPVRVFRFGDRALATGVETHDPDGTAVRIDSREKTLADCCKYGLSVEQSWVDGRAVSYRPRYHWL